MSLEFLIAIILGMISQNIRTMAVMRTMEIPIPFSPHAFTLNEAAILETKTLANILPTKIVIRSSVGRLRRDSNRPEFLAFSIFMRFSLILLRLKIEVSEPEKNADKNKSIRSAPKW